MKRTELNVVSLTMHDSKLVIHAPIWRMSPKDTVRFEADRSYQFKNNERFTMESSVTYGELSRECRLSYLMITKMPELEVVQF